MYQDCISSLSVDADDDGPDDDPPTAAIGGAGVHHISWSPPAPTTSAVTMAPFMIDLVPDPNPSGLSGDDTVNRLAHELDEQASLTDTHLRRLHSSRRPIPRNYSRADDPAAGRRSRPRIRNAVSTPGGPLAESWFDAEEPGISFQQTAHARPDVPVTWGDPCSDADRHRRQTEPRPPQNHCRENLLTTMVEHSVQCNVQGSAPSEHPGSAPRRPSHQRLQCLAEPGSGGRSNYNGGGRRGSDVHRPPGLIAFDDMAGLEVDPSYCEADDDVLLRDIMALREAGGPAGIRKTVSAYPAYPNNHHHLRYRSSADVGAQYRNLKRNVPRMRRRPNTKTGIFADTGSGSGSGTHAPATVPVGARSTA